MSMTAVKQFWTALAVVLIAGVLGVTGASAEELIASKTGHLTGKALNTQKLKFGKATFECTKAEGSGEITELKTTSLPWTVKLGNCSLLSVGTATVTLLDETLFWFKPASVLHVDTDFSASAFGLKCSVSMPFGQSIGSSTEITWVNKAGKIEEKNTITNIEYEVTESNTSSLCGTVGEKGTKGSYSGNDEIELEGGTIEIK
jgi:hypothetical protein